MKGSNKNSFALLAKTTNKAPSKKSATLPTPVVQLSIKAAEEKLAAEKNGNQYILTKSKKTETLTTSLHNFVDKSKGETANQKWKKSLTDLKDSFLDLALEHFQKKEDHEYIDYNKYKLYKERLKPAIEALTKTFLRAPIEFTLVKYVAIQIFEEVLYKVENLPDILKATFFYHMANFNCQHEHDSWRSSVYSNALINLSKKYPDSEELTLLSNKVQKIDEYSQEGLRRFVDQRIEQPDSIIRKFTIENPTTDISDGLKTKHSTLSWTKPLDFSIITGKNGAGKSAMLTSLQDFYRTRLLRKEDSEPYYSLYMRSEELGGRLVHGENSYDFRYPFVMEDLDVHLDFTIDRTKISKRVPTNPNSRLAVAIADRIFIGELKRNQVSSEKALEIAEYLFFSQNSLCEPSTLVENIFKQYMNLFINDLFDNTKRFIGFIDTKISGEDSKDFKTEIEHLLGTNFTEEFEKYRNIITKNKEKLNKFAFYINQNRDKFYDLCKEYNQQCWPKFSSPFSVITKLNQYFDDYKIGYSWMENHPSGNYLKYVTSLPRELEKNIIYLYEEDGNLRYQKIGHTSPGTISSGLIKKNQDGSVTTLSQTNIFLEISKQGNIPLGKFRITFSKDSESLNIYTLSSGELMIFKLMLWSYASKGLDFGSRSLESSPSKVKLLLLDEIDRHLDPKLVTSMMNLITGEFYKKDVKIIMTTHRPDTLALAPQEAQIFTVQPNDKNEALTEIVETHPLLAMFRLTENLREITGHHHVVYTESRNDALFYEGVYKTLMHYCDLLRIKNEVADWQIADSNLKYLLSRRSQFSFTSVSSERDGNGGCAKVIEYISSDITAHKNLERGKDKKKVSILDEKAHNLFYTDLQLSGSYGILDNDHGKEYPFINIGTAELGGIIKSLPEKEKEPRIERGKERATVLKRHSLENYIFDPFILCSTLTESEIIGFIDKTTMPDLYKEKMKEAFRQIYIFFQTEDLSEEDATGILTLYHSIFNNNKKHIDGLKKCNKDKADKLTSLKLVIKNAENTCQRLIELIELKSNTESYEKIISDLLEIATAKSYPDLRSKFIQENKAIKSSTTLEETPKEPVIHAKDTEEPTKYVEKYVISGSETLIKAPYPEEIINCRGHDLGTYLFYGWLKLKDGNYIKASKEISNQKDDIYITVSKEMSNLIVERIYSKGLKLIPLDLAETLFDLNFNLRKHVREILKQNKIKPLTWPEKIAIKKAAKQSAALTDQSTSAAADAEDSSADSDDGVPPLENVEISEKDQTVNLLYSITPTNPLLSIANFIPTVRKIAGSMEGVNNLIALGEDPEISESIKSAINERGLETVIHLLLTKSQNTPLLDDAKSPKTTEYNINPNAAAALVTLDIIESAPTIKYFIKDILQLDVEPPKLSNYIWTSTHFIFGSIGAALLPTNYPIIEKIAFVGMNSINYGARIQLYESADKIGILPTIAGQMLLTLAKHHSAPICSYKTTLYDLAITTSIGGMQYYQNYFNDLSREKTLIETIIPYGADIITLVFASQNINLPNGDPISYIYFAKELLATTSAIVMTDYASKTLLNLISNNAQIIYDYFSSNDSNSIDLAGNTNNPILE
jgi:energy-coupling factor transporter ATP-binding protein EcfA2